MGLVGQKEKPVTPSIVAQKELDAMAKVLLMTQNVSGLCADLAEDPRCASLPIWIAVLADLIAKKDADFIALHMQEVGGSAWKTIGAKPAAEIVAHSIAAAFTEYWSSGMFINLDTTANFTALGSIYLVRSQREMPFANTPNCHHSRSSQWASLSLTQL